MDASAFNVYKTPYLLLSFSKIAIWNVCLLIAKIHLYFCISSHTDECDIPKLSQGKETSHWESWLLSIVLLFYYPLYLENTIWLPLLYWSNNILLLLKVLQDTVRAIKHHNTVRCLSSNKAFYQVKFETLWKIATISFRGEEWMKWNHTPSKSMIADLQ